MIFLTVLSLLPCLVGKSYLIGNLGTLYVHTLPWVTASFFCRLSRKCYSNGKLRRQKRLGDSLMRGPRFVCMDGEGIWYVCIIFGYEWIERNCKVWLVIFYV